MSSDHPDGVQLPRETRGSLQIQRDVISRFAQNRHKPAVDDKYETATSLSHLYADVAQALHSYSSCQGSLKGLCLAPSIKRKRATMALACSTLYHRPTIDALLNLTMIGNSSVCNPHPPWLLRVLICDAIISGRRLPTGAQSRDVRLCIRLVRRHLPTLKDIYSRQLLSNVELRVGSDSAGQPGRLCSLPRYARINGLRTTREAVAAALAKEGFGEESFEALVARAHLP
eukprot:CAMPEP_0113708294 /NCGR_PEP_ID=MMETSP0038_2-20120614/28887_1 /TAXON_ID=2898 /ORGANISM="Cryptomonas paramecium" /LENGTH=228 /DNA_ID=CAMNT_0000633955 /DNA_START=161 /DNA_END=844 /DNA_ORIENTATION=+ /assembly_acc=CAM_ASM_000170